MNEYTTETTRCKVMCRPLYGRHQQCINTAKKDGFCLVHHPQRPLRKRQTWSNPNPEIVPPPVEEPK